MRSRRRNTNIKILQSQIQDIAIDHDETLPRDPIEAPKSLGRGIAPREVPIETKVKKRGIPKDALINTKRLLTM